jgi:hypothetical protein
MADDGCREPQPPEEEAKGQSEDGGKAQDIVFPPKSAKEVGLSTRPSLGASEFGFDLSRASWLVMNRQCLTNRNW